MVALFAGPRDVAAVNLDVDLEFSCRGVFRPPTEVHRHKPKLIRAPAGFTPTWSFAGLVANDSAATLTYNAAYNIKDVATATTLK